MQFVKTSEPWPLSCAWLKKSTIGTTDKLCIESKKRRYLGSDLNIRQSGKILSFARITNLNKYDDANSLINQWKFIKNLFGNLPKIEKNPPKVGRKSPKHGKRKYWTGWKISSRTSQRRFDPIRRRWLWTSPFREPAHLNKKIKDKKRNKKWGLTIKLK